MLVNSVGEHDFSAQETCHLLLQLPLVKSTRDHTILGLDGSRQVQQQEGADVDTVPSILDHYTQRPRNSTFENMTLIYFAQNYTMPKELSTTPKQQKMKEVSVRPHISPDPNSPKFEQYCKQKLMLHVPFRSIDQLKGACSTFAEAYSIFLHSSNAPPSLEDDIVRFNDQQVEQDENNDNEVCNELYNAHVVNSYFTGFFCSSKSASRRMDVNMSTKR